jgi:hypothetical protein
MPLHSELLLQKPFMEMRFATMFSQGTSVVTVVDSSLVVAGIGVVVVVVALASSSSKTGVLTKISCETGLSRITGATPFTVKKSHASIMISPSLSVALSSTWMDVSPLNAVAEVNVTGFRQQIFTEHKPEQLITFLTWSGKSIFALHCSFTNSAGQ